MPSIWIDIANSPQVLFFKPVIDELHKNGIETIITVRDFAQTVPLSEKLGLEFHVVGKHDGKSRLKKGIGLFRRAFQLMDFYRKTGLKVSLALSHNSYHHILATKMLGIRTMTFMDFEGQKANHLAFRLADRVVVPIHFKREYLKKYGAGKEKVLFYDGLKEEVYLWNFEPGEDYIKEMGIERDLPIAAVRTPPDYALYHRKDNLFMDVLRHLSGRARVILLPRTEEQKEKLESEFPHFIIPNVAVDGPRLLYWSDFSISGGGTMNRESALLGTPAYSVFKGVKSGVDEYLERMGLLKYIDKPSDIRVEKKSGFRTFVRGRRVLEQIMDFIFRELESV